MYKRQSAGLSILEHAKHLGPHAELVTTGMLALESADIVVEGVELSQIISRLKNPASHEKLAAAIEEHSKSHH